MGFGPSWSHIGNNHVINQKRPMLTGLKVSSLQRVNVYFTYRNIIERGLPHGIEFWSSWNAKMKYTNEYSSRNRRKKWDPFYLSRLLPELWSLKYEKCLIFCMFCWWQQKTSHSMAKFLSESGQIRLDYKFLRTIILQNIM